jgi:hypothetical protein
VKIGDLVRFRMAYGMQEDYSPPALIIDRFPVPDEALWIALCHGMRCVIDEENYEVQTISECRRFSEGIVGSHR